MKTKKVPFDITKAKAGAKIVTKSGLKVKILYFPERSHEVYKVVANVIDACGKKSTHDFDVNGKCIYKEDFNLDLFIEEDD